MVKPHVVTETFLKRDIPQKRQIQAAVRREAETKETFRAVLRKRKHFSVSQKHPLFQHSFTESCSKVSLKLLEMSLLLCFSEGQPGLRQALNRP